jgi:drug/metabolite transporter (DMT)-like permease
MQAALFIIVSAAWGLTWYAIHLQLGPTPDAVSIFWRFALAASCMWLILLVSGKSKAARPRQHLWFAAMGLTLFSGNFLLFYAAEQDVPSGLVSVVFSLATAFNAFNLWVFYGFRPSRRVLLGAALGAAGVGLLFADRIVVPDGGHFVRGIGLALVGTFSFSLGNLASRRATADGTSLLNAIARGMSWGALFLAAVVLAGGEDFVPQTSAAYLGGLAYLVIFGSVIGFFAYLSLAARIGPAHAAYTTVISPVIALAVSSLLEGYAWRGSALTGVLLILLGNIVIFARIGGLPWAKCRLVRDRTEV